MENKDYANLKYKVVKDLKTISIMKSKNSKQCRKKSRIKLRLYILIAITIILLIAGIYLKIFNMIDVDRLSMITVTVLLLLCCASIHYHNLRSRYDTDLYQFLTGKIYMVSKITEFNITKIGKTKDKNDLLYYYVIEEIGNESKLFPVKSKICLDDIQISYIGTVQYYILVKNNEQIYKGDNLILKYFPKGLDFPALEIKQDLIDLDSVRDMDLLNLILSSFQDWKKDHEAQAYLTAGTTLNKRNNLIHKNSLKDKRV